MTDEAPKVYYCPTAGDVESYPGGGFDVCCDRPDLHRPVKWTDMFGIDRNYLKDAAEEPTLTASEVKVLTETASKVAYALGRKDALEEVEARLTEAGARGRFARQLIQHTVSQAPGATSDATSGVPGHQEVSEAARSPQEPCGHPTCPCASQEA